MIDRSDRGWVPDPVTRGDWFVTASGRRVFLTDPDPEQIVIEDIAHALSQVCRFGGHCQTFYSVAQHSVLVSHIVGPGAALAGLMHDASEAYLGDVIRPLKRLVPDYKPIESRWEHVIECRFGIAEACIVHRREIKRADMIALATERRDVHALAFEKRGEWEWIEDELGFAARDERIEPWSPERARAEFLARFVELGGVA